MAKLVVVSVFDSAAQAFGRPVFVPSTGVAIRSFMDEVNRQAPDNQMYLHPDDFTLYYIADFDESDSVFVNVDDPSIRMLMRGKDAARKE